MKILLAVTFLMAASVGTAGAADLTAAERAAIFKAAGFKAQGKNFVRCVEDTSASRLPGSIEMQDLNGDGRNEAIVSESSLFCYGNTEQAFVVLTQDAKGAWSIVLDEVGVPTPLEVKHNGWRDVEVGGPGMGPFPVFKFDGKKYGRKK